MLAHLKPVGDYVLVRDLPSEDAMLSSVIEIPETIQDPPMRGTVVAVGPGRVSRKGVRLPMSVSEGDVVLFGQLAGTRHEGGWRMLREQECLAVLEGA